MEKPREQYDVLCVHDSCEQSERLIADLKDIIADLAPQIGSDVKVVSTHEDFRAGTLFDNMEDCLSRYGAMLY